MKTSTKIFLGVAVAAIAICAANAINAGIQDKKLRPVAEKLAAQLERTDIRVVDFNSTDTCDTEYLKYRFSRSMRGVGYGQYLNVGADLLKTVRISGDTLFLSGNRSNTEWYIFNSPALETVVVHKEGMPDEVMDYRPTEEEMKKMAEEHTEDE